MQSQPTWLFLAHQVVTLEASRSSSISREACMKPNHTLLPAGARLANEQQGSPLGYHFSLQQHAKLHSNIHRPKLKHHGIQILHPSSARDTQ
jgi:hypothetical protein